MSDPQNKKFNKIFSAGRSKEFTYMLSEPFTEEMKRIRFDELSSSGIDFAYKLEGLKSKEAKPKDLKVNAKYENVFKESHEFYSRYTLEKNSPSLGLIVTNIDLSRIQKENDNPVLWQMGPERIRLALSQRALFFDQNQNDSVHENLQKIENNKIKFIPRQNKRSQTVDEILGIKKPGSPALFTPALSELGYKKISTSGIISRRIILEKGLFNIIGKYPRKILGLGAMPPVTGWRDTLITSAIGHMVSFIPRSSIFAFDISKRIKLGQEVKGVINSLSLPELWKQRVLRNIGAALGAEDPQQELKMATRLFQEAGIALFRIYTIGSDTRVIKTAKLIRQKLGSQIEIFVGQIADKKQAEKLIHPDIAVDGLVYGHGGGQQCTSAINGMAITTLEDIYEITLDKRFNKTSILVEGGVGRSIGTALILGIDCCLGNQKSVRGTIETGNLFAQDLEGKICQPYPGTASPVTQIIESIDPKLRVRRLDTAGRTYTSEGKPGLMYYEDKAGSMAFWINEYLRHAARTLADMGVTNIYMLRTLLRKNPHEYLRIMSEKTQYLSEPHWNIH